MTPPGEGVLTTKKAGGTSLGAGEFAQPVIPSSPPKQQPRFSLLATVKDQVPQSTLTLAEIADLVRNCPELKAATEVIQQEYRAGILEGFKSIDKVPYQRHKTATLPAFITGGVVATRAAGAQDLQPSGYVCLDIDESPREDLEAFFSRVQRGEFKPIGFCSRSVSGTLNGSLAALLKVSLPTSYKSTPRRIRAAFGITKTTPWPKAIEALTDAYHTVFRYLLEKNAGVSAGTAGKSPYNTRYLSHDPQAYYNPDAATFGLKEMLKIREEMERDNTRETGASLQAAACLSAAGSGPFGVADAYAKGKGYELREGQRHEYLTRFAIACNLLGVPREAVQTYVAEKGIEVRSNCISYPYAAYKESHGQWQSIAAEAERERVIQGKEGQRLTDVLPHTEGIGKWVISPTGSGKNWWVDKLPGRKIVVCPTLSLVDDVCREYKAVPYTGAKRDMCAIREAEFIATTYASFKSLDFQLQKVRREIHLCVDEAHNFTAGTSRSFQLACLTVLLEKAENYKSFTALTGTHLYNRHPLLRNKDRVTVKLPTTKKTFGYLEAKDTLKAAAGLFKASARAGRCPLILFNNKSDEGRLGTLKAMLPGGVGFINSDTKAKQAFKAITGSGKIPESLCGLVATSSLKEGNNIYNRRKFDIIVLGSFHAADIHQFASRPRLPEDVRVTIVRSINRNRDNNGFSPPQIADWMEKNAQASCDELNTQDRLTHTQMERELSARRALKADPITWNESARRYEVDYLALSNDVFNLERKAQNRNDALMIAALEGYGMTYRGSEEHHHQQTPQERAAASMSRERAKVERAEAFAEALATLEAQPAPLDFADRQLKARGSKLKSAEQAAYSRFVGLCGVGADPDSALKELRDMGPSKSKFDLLLKRLKVAALRRDEEYMAANRKMAIVLKAIYSQFTAGERLSSLEIAARMQRAFALDAGLDLSYLEETERADRYLKLARVFFDLPRKDCRNEDGQKVVRYEVCTLDFDNVFYKSNAKTRVQIPSEMTPAECLHSSGISRRSSLRAPSTPGISGNMSYVTG